MASEKSLAAEIKAVLQKHHEASYFAREGFKEAIPQCAAEIAALQSRAFEDGARWMRERAGQHLASEEDGYAAWDRWIPRLLAEEVAALPLQPEGERSDG